MDMQTYQISVRELVSFSIPGEDNRTLSLNSVARDGIEGHQFMHELLKQQSEAIGTYRKEVSVSCAFSHKEYHLQISGRLDGLIEGNQNLTLCEIKTTERDLASLERTDNPSYWAQGRCYAYMVAREKGLDKINLLLIYFHRSKKEYRSFEETLTFTDLEKFFHSLVYPYINGLIKQHEWQNTRNESIRILPFPYTEFRKGQRAMSAAIYRAIRDGNKQFIQAPTGIGKTLGSLFPAVKAMGEGLIDTLFYLTARNTTQAIAAESYEMMVQNGLRLKTVQITAKEKVCFSPGAACTPEECPYLIDYSEKSRTRVSSLMKDYDFFNRDNILDSARKHQMCPFELSLDLSLQADLILCDYNYVFDPRVYLKRFFQDKTDKKICLMVDEAHNLADRAREMYSAEIKRSTFRIIYQQIKNTLPELALSLKKARKAFLEYITSLPGIPEGYKLPMAWTVSDPPESLIQPIENFLYCCEEIFQDETPYPFKEELITFFFELAHFTKIYDFFGEHYTTFLLQDKGEFTVRLFCIDPSPMLKKRMKDAKSTILFSATLSPPAYFKEILGGDEKDGYLMLPSPFPRHNLYLFIEDTVSTRYRHREESVHAVVHRIHDAVSAKTGNYLVFFPSFSYMNSVARKYQEIYPEDVIMVQQSGMDEPQREEFLNRFASFGDSTLIAFAVMGGIFGEGIDLKGEYLSGAIIVGVGLPQICAERDIIKSYYQRINGNGFDFAYTYPGLNKVQQAAGRVIRSEQDRGFVILIDERFSTPLYQKIMPSEWFPPITPRPHDNLVDQLKQFWGNN